MNRHSLRALALLLAVAAAAGQESGPLAQAAREVEEAGKVWSSRSGRNSYSRGSSALHRGAWEEAAKHFEEAVRAKDSRADGAMYWRAWALHKLGRKDEAMGVLAALTKEHPQSRWSNDAKVLEVEVKQSSGQPVSPEEFSNEEIKLYALNGLVNTEPDRAMPMIEKILSGPGSPQLRERAMFVLAQIKAPRAKELLGKIARGQNANPDMQLWAVRYLGHSREKDVLPVLAEVYAGTADVSIKRQVIEAYGHHRDAARLVEVVRTEKDADLRRRALDNLRDAKPLIELARAEKDPVFRKEIVRRISGMKSKEAADYLIEVLNQ
ncbi:MAG: tetratricopeptide repeat protein [Acidobacteria bacterium]|nr:tetratricopeptide repeat protein [Acidobacteriota bacterium]